MEYKTVRGCGEHLPDAIADLEASVNALLQDGWMPCGGVALLYLGNVTVDSRRYTAC